MKLIAMNTHYSYYETTNDERGTAAESERDISLTNDLKAVYEKHGFVMVESSTSYFPSEKLSLFHCEECNSLMVNRELNPSKLEPRDPCGCFDLIIKDGGTLEGKNICSGCLPSTNRWGHDL